MIYYILYIIRRYKFKRQEYKIILKGLKDPKGTISLVALSKFSEVIIQTSEKLLRYLVDGVSTKRGKIPEWLSESVNFTFTGIEAGSTQLNIIAPNVKDVILSLNRQTDIFEEDISYLDTTAISLLYKSFDDISKGKADSKYIEYSVLKSMANFKLFTEQYANSTEIVNANETNEIISINKEKIKLVNDYLKRIPSPRKGFVSGLFNQIEHKKMSFQLIQDNNKKIRGEIKSDSINKEMMRELWGKKVTLKGTVFYKPSGDIQFIEAEMIKPFEERDNILSVKEGKESVYELKSRLSKSQKWIDRVWGKWPGDENIKDLLNELN